MRLPDREAPYEGRCLVTPLLPFSSGWRSLLRRRSPDMYDFGSGLEEWQRTAPTTGYLLPDAVAVSYRRLPRHERRDRQFVSLLAVKTGHIAIGGIMTGWRLDPLETSTEAIEAADDTGLPPLLPETELPNIDGVTRLSKAPRLVIPESRLIPVAEWNARPASWPGLRTAYAMPPDGRPRASIRDPERVAEAFKHIQASPGGLS